jgi:HSP20 family protein
MTLMQFDPFRELDRFAERTVAAARAPRAMPMEAFRRGDTFTVALDVPGVDPKELDVTVERNVVTIRGTRRPLRGPDDELIVGEITRQLFLGDNLDTQKMQANVDRGVLILTIPVSETSKPRRIEIPEQSSGGTEVGATQANQAERAGASS